VGRVGGWRGGITPPLPRSGALPAGAGSALLFALALPPHPLPILLVPAFLLLAEAVRRLPRGRPVSGPAPFSAPFSVDSTPSSSSTGFPPPAGPTWVPWPWRQRWESGDFTPWSGWRCWAPWPPPGFPGPWRSSPGGRCWSGFPGSSRSWGFPGPVPSSRWWSGPGPPPCFRSWARRGWGPHGRSRCRPPGPGARRGRGGPPRPPPLGSRWRREASRGCPGREVGRRRAVPRVALVEMAFPPSVVRDPEEREARILEAMSRLSR
jgi:hypothetical protein